MTTVTNGFPNPRAEGPTNGFENNVGSTVGVTGSAIEGTVSYQLTYTATTTGNTRSRLVDRAAAAPGQRWFARATIRNNGATQRQVSLGIVPWTAVPGGTAGSSLTTQQQTVIMNAGEVREFLITYTSLPATTQSVGILITRYSGTNAAIGDTLTVDKVMFAQLTDPAMSPPVYGDPTISPLWFWNGTPDASTSQLPITKPVLTALTDMDPSPRVRVEVGAFIPNTAYVTVLRTVDGSTVPVPGAEYQPVTTSLLKVDYYPPQQTAASYQIEMFTAAGASLGFSESTAVTINDGRTFLQSPIDPRKVVVVDLAGSAASELSETNVGTVHQIGDKRILIASGGTGLDNLNMDFWTGTLDQYRAALAVFRDAKGLVVIRTPPPIQVPRVLYLWSPKPVRMEYNLPAGIEEFDWSNTGQEVSPPSARVLAAVITYNRFKKYYPTYGAFKAAYATYKQAILNPPADL